MNDLSQFPLVYLATPYTKYRAGIEQAFIDASALAARLMVSGVKVYSPIAHTHPMAIHGGINPLDHSVWLPFDEAMMSACSALAVAKMQGWDESYGIAYEIKHFESRGAPVFYLCPAELTTEPRAALTAGQREVGGS